MADRNERIRIFEQTIGICRSDPDLQSAIRQSIAKQRIVWEEDPPAAVEERYDHPAALAVTPERTFEAALKYLKTGKRICVLNFASSVTPGGGVAKGAGSQEESLCRISTLYPAISDRETAGAFYDRHWQMIRSGEMSRKNRDDCIFTPGIKVIREDTFDCAMLPRDEWYEVDVITCAAPDLRYDSGSGMYQPGKAELSAVFEKRWRRILSVAALNKEDILILGAFGCGAFYNPPEVVVQAFGNVFHEFARCFEVVEFAVFAQGEDDPNYRVFSGMKDITPAEEKDHGNRKKEKPRMKNIWKEGVFGVVVGDALGCPVQFESREKVAEHPVTGMRGYGSFNLPAGSWTDDSSLTLALLDSICRTGKMNLKDIMGNFVEWLEHGAFTPYGYAYDIGFGTEQAIESYEESGNPFTCGGTAPSNNGNGSLMRIMPACLYCCAKGMGDEEAVRAIHAVGSLTHAHIRSNIACGLYFFMIRSVLDGEGSLRERMQKGLDRGFAFYGKMPADPSELGYYDRLRDLASFAKVPAEEIQSSGYVVETLEAVVWALVTTGTFEEALLKVVNLGRDTDTTGAIAGGLAALYYGYDAIPAAWIDVIQKKEWIGDLCGKVKEIIK